MMTDDMEVRFTAARLGFILREHGARPLDDRQGEALARYVNELQCKIDDLGDELDTLKEAQ